MANNIPNSARQSLLTRWITRPTNAPVVKLALMLTAAGNARDAYTSTNETTATGYTAGGSTVTGLTTAIATNKGVLDATDTPCGTLTGNFQYGDLYDDANTPKQVLVTYDFAAQSPAGVAVTVEWPVADATNAMVRVA
jgi:hypothetical protein